MLLLSAQSQMTIVSNRQSIDRALLVGFINKYRQEKGVLLIFLYCGSGTNKNVVFVESWFGVAFSWDVLATK